MKLKIENAVRFPTASGNVIWMQLSGDPDFRLRPNCRFAPTTESVPSAWNDFVPIYTLPLPSFPFPEDNSDHLCFFTCNMRQQLSPFINLSKRIPQFGSHLKCCLGTFWVPGHFFEHPKRYRECIFYSRYLLGTILNAILKDPGVIWGQLLRQSGFQKPNLGDGCAPARQCCAAELSFRMTFWKTVMIFIGRRVLAAGGSSSVGSKLILHAKSWGGGGSSSVGSKLI